MKKNPRYIILQVIILFLTTVLFASCKEKVYTEKEFFNAIRQNKIEIVQTCLDQGMSAETYNSDYTVLSCLAYAVRRDRLEIVKLLLEHGADITNKTVLPEAVRNNNKEMVLLLIEHGADVNATQAIGYTGTPETVIIIRDNLNSSLLMAHLRYDGSTTSESGKPKYERMLKVVELFLQYGADPNYVSEKTGLSPLRIALNYDLREAVDLLLQYGAIPRKEPIPIDFLGDFNYNDPLNFREWDEDYGVVWQSDLLLFAYNGYTDLLMPYIESGEISPDDATPLGHDYYYYAVWGGHPDTIMALLPYLDNINRRYNNGFYVNISLLYLAGLHDHAEAVSVLVENGANYRLAVFDKNGFEEGSSSIFKEHALKALIDFYENRKRYPEYRVTKKAVQ